MRPKLLESGWLGVLSETAKDILEVFEQVVTDKERIVRVSYNELQTTINKSRAAIAQALEELQVFSFIEAVSGEERKRAYRVKGVPGVLSSGQKALLHIPLIKQSVISLIQTGELSKQISEAIVRRLSLKGKSKNIPGTFEQMALKGLLAFVDEYRGGFTDYQLVLLEIGKRVHQSLTVPRQDRTCSSERIPLAPGVRAKLNRWEKEVIDAFEYYTGTAFSEQEIPLLKEALSICPPSGIVRGISKHPNPREVNSFAYFMTLIRRGVFGRRKKSAPKGGKKVEQKLDPKGYRNFTDEQVAEWEQRFAKLRAQQQGENPSKA